MRIAGSMLLIKDGLILGVSRKHNHDSFGLPGGKCEFGESSREASIRETYEETGVLVLGCEQLYYRIEPGGPGPNSEDFHAYCYFATYWTGNPETKEEGVVKWVTEEDLIGENGAFPEYNSNMLRIFKERHPEVKIL